MDHDCEAGIESNWRPGRTAVATTIEEPTGRLTAATRVAHIVLAEHDLPPVPELTLTTIVRAALDARAILAGASLTWPSTVRLRLLLETLILFCAQPDLESEGI